MANDPDVIEARGLWRWWPLRFVVDFVVLVSAYVGCQFIVFFVHKHPHGLPENIVVFAAALLGALGLCLFYRALVWWTERRLANEIRISRSPGGFLGGAVIGIGLFCALYAVLWASGVAVYRGLGTTDGVALAFSLALLSGVCEEIIFRGVVFRLFEEGFGTTVAVLFSGALFGLIHAGNHGATLASSAAIALEAGILLAAAYAWTRSLWLPIGLHFGWNFTEGGIFGAAVSGTTNKGLFHFPLSGPVYLTGGEFGPEASVASVGVCLLAALIMLALAVRRGNWQPMRFRFRSAAT
jgi:uncharacterized protein